MKKLLTFLLALAMCLSFAACGAPAPEDPAAAPEAEAVLPEEDIPVEEKDYFAGLSPEYTLELPVYEVVSTVNCWDSYSDDTYEYTDFVVDESGRVVHLRQDGEFQGENYEYDEFGHQISSAPDTSGTKWVYEYDDAGYMVRSTNFNMSSPEDVRINEIVNDENGNMVERYFDGELAYTYENSYDDNGFLLRQSELDVEDGDITVNDYTYDALGRISSRTEDNFDGDGSHESTYVTTVTYNELGFIIRSETETTFDEDGDLSGSHRESNWAAVGYYTVDSAEDDRILGRDQWTSMEGQPALPAPETVFAGIHPADTVTDGENTYLLDNPGYGPYQAVDYFAGNSIAYPPTHSVCEGANYAYWVYLAALESMGYQTRVNDRGCMVMDEDGVLLAEISRRADEDLGYLMVIHSASRLSPEDRSSETETGLVSSDRDSTAAQSSSVSSATSGQKNALNSALMYLEVLPFSYDGLVEQLEYEGYSYAEATYAADHCGADWNEQAVRSAEQYLDILSFSRSELQEQLEFDGFTSSQASYGVDRAY